MIVNGHINSVEFFFRILYKKQTSTEFFTKLTSQCRFGLLISKERIIEVEIILKKKKKNLSTQKIFAFRLSKFDFFS